jgi:hypothetical protein
MRLQEGMDEIPDYDVWDWFWRYVQAFRERQMSGPGHLTSAALLTLATAVHGRREGEYYVTQAEEDSKK